MTRIIALTGGSGFVGRRLVPRLAGTGVRVRLLARSPKQLSGIAEGAAVIAGDLQRLISVMSRLSAACYDL